MPEIIGFYSPKGGCGATFSCAAVWNSLSNMGKKTLAIDLCSGHCTLDFALGMQNYSVYTVADVLDGVCGFKDALCVSELNEKAFFLKGTHNSSVLDLLHLKDILKNSGFEYILADLSANVFDENADYSVFLDRIIAVTDCTEISVKMCESFFSENEYKNARIIINKIIPSYIDGKILLTADEVADGIGIAPIGLIPWSPEAIPALSRGVKSGISDVNLINAFHNTALRIMGENTAAIDFNMRYGCFKIKRRR